MRSAFPKPSAVPTLALALCLVFLLPGPARALEKASLVLQWLPQAQFAGYFVALDKGFYAEEGIDLTIRPGGPDILASEQLEDGRADFATLFLTTGLERHESLPLVNIAQIVQHSALMLIARTSSGIKTFHDLDGRKVGLWANEFQIQPRALFRRENIHVTVVPQTSSLDLFMRGGVAACSGMWYNEYHTLLTYGLDETDLQPLFFTDAGLNFPEDGIYCLDKTARERPEVCAGLVRATLKGWRWAFEHKDEALDIVLRHMEAARVPAGRAHQRWMLERMEDVTMPEGVPMGVLRREDYERVVRALTETRFVDHPPSYEDFYKGEAQ
ncbi:ABC transporter substrate-binding protein [Pseudodesulfovibrio mercurii]|uniref:Thiamine pyrimidine synthase n=1 Tax=Pseudodesulfovibrio mercurii TaxID=641491 RepID=F0JEQ0_9BACT|nr:ABC transporter substrate-binding protein [Pseudodesulfovibrio mercurii]EGB14779.1 ABC transporter substrate-binding protein [Pseudodesulfovibrio mercurii]